MHPNGESHRPLSTIYTRTYECITNAIVSSLAAGRPINTWPDIFVRIRFSPMSISFGVKKLKCIFLSSLSITSPSRKNGSRHNENENCARCLYWGYYLKAWIWGYYLQGAHNKVSCPAIHSWAATNDGSSCSLSSIWYSPPMSSTLKHHGHILSVLIFSAHGDDNEVSLLILANSFRIYFFVSIYRENFFPE